MSTVSSTILLSAVDTYVKAPTRENREALISAADDYREIWVFGQATDSTLPRQHWSNVSGTAPRTQKFDLSRIMEMLARMTNNSRKKVS